MRAMLLEGSGRLSLVDAPMPSLVGGQDVLIRVRAVGICGSEVHAFHGTHPYRKAPVILGHEAAGDVVEVGRDVRAFKPGQRVIVDPQASCGECEWCRAGDINLCPAKKVLGTSVWPGAFGEYIVAPEHTLFRLPANLSYVQGALIEPLTVAVHVVRRAGVKTGESVAVLGTGSIGCLVAGVCHGRGASPIVGADIREHCLRTAVAHGGVRYPFLLPDDTFVEKAKEALGGDGADVVFVCADDVTLVNQAIALAKRRGRIVLVAILTEAPLSFAAFPVISKELTIIGSVMSRHSDVKTAIRLAAGGQVDVQAIATHILPIEQAQRGMELAMTKSDGAIKTVLTF